MKRVTLPTFYCPFPPQINPLVEEIHQHTFAWATSLHLLQQEEAMYRFQASRFAWLAARAYPRAGFEEVALVNDFLVWLFLLDDQFDDGEIGRQPERIQAILHHLFATFDHAQTPQSLPHQSPIVAALDELWRRILALTTPQWQKRFTRHLRAYFDSYEWETCNRAEGNIPDVEVYIEKRQDTGAMFLALDYIDLTEHVNLPAAIYESSQVQALLRATNNAVCWSNDILSLEKEITRGDLNNLVLSVHKEQDCTLQEAIDQVNAMTTSEVKFIEQLSTSLPAVFPAYTQELHKYIAVTQAWIRGNLDWSFETRRYTDIELSSSEKTLSYLERILPEEPVA